MRIINKLIGWFYNIELPLELNKFEPEYNRKNPSDSCKYNFATGLPMVGGLDIMGNIIGTDSRNDYSHYTNSMNDYYRYYSR